MCTLPSHLRSLLLATPPCPGWITSPGTRSRPCQAPRAGSHKQHSEPRRGERVSTESTGRVTSRASVSVSMALWGSSPAEQPHSPSSGPWGRSHGPHLSQIQAVAEGQWPAPAVQGKACGRLYSFRAAHPTPPLQGAPSAPTLSWTSEWGWGLCMDRQTGPEAHTGSSQAPRIYPEEIYCSNGEWQMLPTAFR